MTNHKKRQFEKKPYSGPVDDTQWPEGLPAHVVDSREQPRIHGYDVEGDLAKHYSFSETILLSFTGELPRDDQAAAFEAALVFCAPVFIGDASAHTAAVGRLAGAAMSGVASAAIACASEEVSQRFEPLRDLIGWLDTPTGDPPPSIRPHDASDIEGARRLTAALSSRGIQIPALEREIGLSAAIIAVLHHCGLTTIGQMIFAVVSARIPCILAETLHWKPGRFKVYPMDLPPFAYEEPKP